MSRLHPIMCPYCDAEIHRNGPCRCPAPSQLMAPPPPAPWDAVKARARFARPSFFNEPDPLAMASARPALAAGGVRNGSRG